MWTKPTWRLILVLPFALGLLLHVGTNIARGAWWPLEFYAATALVIVGSIHIALVLGRWASRESTVGIVLTGLVQGIGFFVLAGSLAQPHLSRVGDHSSWIAAIMISAAVYVQVYLERQATSDQLDG